MKTSMRMEQMRSTESVEQNSKNEAILSAAREFHAAYRAYHGTPCAVSVLVDKLIAARETLLQAVEMARPKPVFILMEHIK